MLRAPFPPPDRSILGVRGLTDLHETAFLQHAGRRVGLGERVRADQSHACVVCGEVNQRARRFGSVSPTLARRHDAVGDLTMPPASGPPLNPAGPATPPVPCSTTPEPRPQVVAAP